MIHENFVFLGAALNFIGSISYVIDTIKGKAKPNRVTWFLWSLAPLIAFSAELQHGVGIVALMTFMTGFSPFMIFVASFVNRKAYWQISRLDMVCGALSLVGLGLWLATGSGYLAIIFSILADGLAAIPTVVKSYKEPESENWQAFFLAGIGAFITLLTIKTWDFAHVGFPLYIFFTCALLTLLIRFKLGPRLTKPALPSA